MKFKTTLFQVLVVLAIVLSLAIVVWLISFGRQSKLAEMPDSVSNETVNTDSLATSGNLNDSDAESVDMTGVEFDFASYVNINTIADTSSSLTYINLPLGIADVISWMPPKKINKLGFFGTDVDRGVDPGQSASYISSDYYLGGLFKVNDQVGAIVYADVSCIDEMGCSREPISVFVLYDGRVVFLANHEVKPADTRYGFSGVNLVDLVDRKWVAVDKNLTIPYLNFPATISDKNDQWIFKYNGLVLNAEQNYQLASDKKIYTDSVWGDFYINENRPVVYVAGRDFRVRQYLYTPGIVDKDGFVNVARSDSGETILDVYRYTRFGGCGQPVINIVPEDKMVSSTDLQIIGKTTKGNIVYGLKDANHSLLKDFYNQIFYPSADGNISYEEFMATRPAVFWYDQFGLLIMFELNKFTPTAECGKPVIYLYPEKTTKVKVQLQLSKLTVSEPAYGNGWEVVAEPGGQLTEIKSGVKYPYLFWEGLGVGEAEPTNAGFNVKAENVSKFLDEKLVLQGLNQKEIFDFKEFWLPKMQSAPYYFVTFYGTSDMNNIAPLFVSPKPDTVIRVLMDYRAVSAPLNRPEQKLSALPRAGFTLIEWGGVLYK